MDRLDRLISLPIPSFWVEQQIWLVGVGLIIVGLIWKTLVRKLILSFSED